MMGTLYCICKEASIAVCNACPKHRDIKPDHCAGVDTWEKILSPQIIHYSDKPRSIGGK